MHPGNQNNDRKFIQNPIPDSYKCESSENKEQIKDPKDLVQQPTSKSSESIKIPNDVIYHPDRFHPYAKQSEPDQSFDQSKSFRSEDSQKQIGLQHG